MKIKAILAYLLLIVSTVNSQWLTAPSGTSRNLSDIQFIQENKCFAVGDLGTILKSTNNGLTWSSINSPTGANLHSVFFLPNGTGLRGWIGASNGLYKTTDGGNNWTHQITSSIVNDILFTSLNVGYCTGSANVIRKTTNGGTNFTNITFNSEGGKLSRKIIAASNTRFYLLATSPANDSTFIFRSTNQGHAWSRILNVGGTYTAISFGDSNSGVICSNDNNKIAFTENGGDQWFHQVISGTNSFMDVKFSTASNAYICGLNGVIFKTTNKGADWVPQQSGTNQALIGIDFRSSDDTGVVCGNNGTILRTLNGGLTGISQSHSEIPDKYSLSQNYPNPFNPETKIKFDIPDNGLVQLKVFDILGKEVVSIINKEMSPGSYSVNFNASDFSGGVYFYRLSTDKFSETKKMILIK